MGTRASEYDWCVACSEGVAECYARDVDSDGYLDEVALECEGDKYLLQGFGCVDECPHGTYGDDLLGWCVKCSCECESCSIDKTTCDECKGPATWKDGKCVTNSPTAPWAQFNDDW